MARRSDGRALRAQSLRRVELRRRGEADPDRNREPVLNDRQRRNGQSDVRATEHLNAMNQANASPWELSFSFGRALQAPALKAWAGLPANVPSAQQKLLHRARCNGAARFGKYTATMESLPF